MAFIGTVPQSRVCAMYAPRATYPDLKVSRCLNFRARVETCRAQRQYLNAVFFQNNAVPHVFQEGKHAVDMR